MANRGGNRPVGIGFLVLAVAALVAALVLGGEGSTGVYLVMVAVFLAVGVTILVRER